MRKVNYRSDFDAFLRLTDAAGNEVGWPDYDWSALFYTSDKQKGYRASCIGGECFNCFNDGGRIHVVFDRQRMGIGELKVDFEMSIPEEIYPDGLQNIVSPQRLDIMLADSPGDGDMAATLNILLPYVETARPDDRIPDLEEKIENSESRISQLEERYVGVWDELDSIKEAIAIIQDETTNGLLRRLGYTDEDIKWFRFAIMHFDLNISYDDIWESVLNWERLKNNSIIPLVHCTIMPKYTRDNAWGADTPEKFGGCFDLRSVKFFPLVEITDSSENKDASLFFANFITDHISFMAGAIGLSQETEWFYIPVKTIGIGTLENVWPKTYNGNDLPLKYIGNLRNCYRMGGGAFSYCNYLTDLTGADISSSLNAAEGDGGGDIFRVPLEVQTHIGSWDIDPNSNQFEGFCKNRILTGGELHFSGRTPVIGDIYVRDLKIYGYDNRYSRYPNMGGFSRLNNCFYERGGISELHPDILHRDIIKGFVYFENLQYCEGGGKWKLFWPDKSSDPVYKVSSAFMGKTPDVYIYGFHHTQPDTGTQANSCDLYINELLRNFNPETDAAMLKESLASWLSLENTEATATVRMTQAMFDVLDETEDVAPLVSKGYTVTIV